jgi:hypothetical protein
MRMRMASAFFASRSDSMLGVLTMLALWQHGAPMV